MPELPFILLTIRRFLEMSLAYHSFDLYANKNMGVQRIGEYLTEHGIFTRQGKPFSGRSLLIMLRNETYTGRGVRNKFTNGAIFEKHPHKRNRKCRDI